MRIVLDTNVLVSGIFWAGVPYQIIELMFNDHLEIFVTKKILKEYFEVLDRIDTSGETAKKWQLLILGKVSIVEAESNAQFSRDKNDDMFINCALSANADYLISGDQDLLILKQVAKTHIVTPGEFMKIWREHAK